ncbi:XdhC family protein [Pantoea dispersa]|uniref:XdhC family protein n=1 Tax=Pantoea dispersa TaxID=59814 RepID=UPI001C04DB0F|nr:XdhC family protein [Pantoea dispersa]
MHSLDVQVVRMAQQWAEAQPVWLCTVLSTYGPSPRPPGAMMVIRADGRCSGSLSGGCVEENFITRVQQQAFSAASQLVRYGEGGDTPDRALPCGGVLDILVERLPAGAATLRYLQQLEDALTGARAITKRLTLPQPCHALEPAPYTRRTRTQVTDGDIVLTLSAAPRLILAGLSSVAVYCANFALALGFETIVCEHREEVLSNMAAELAPDVKLVQQFPAAYLEREGCHAATAILSLTHDARIDDLTMMEAVNLPAFYLGAMGSQRNSAKRKARLSAIAELTPAQLQRIHAPVGLDIGSKTPAEIALAIMADIVRHKNGLAATDALSPVLAASEG